MDGDHPTAPAARPEAWRAPATAGLVLLGVGLVLDLVVDDLVLTLQSALGGGRATGFALVAYAVRALVLVSIPVGASLLGAAVVVRSLAPARTGGET